MAATAVDSFGQWTATGDYGEASSYAHFFRFTTGANADTITNIRLNTPEGTGGTIKLAIYNYASPYNLIWGDNTGVSATSGWTSVATDRVAIEANHEYFLAYKASATCDIHWQNIGVAKHDWASWPGSWLSNWTDFSWLSNNTNCYNIKGIYVYVTEAPPAGQVIIIH